MGDGEFVGGGSVKWEINHKDDETEGGSKKHKGTDKLPIKGTGGVFSIKVNGVRVVPDFPADGNKIKVQWTPDVD